MRDAREIVRRPVITEKATHLRDSNNQYCFQVAATANKIEIKRAVESLFNVHVVAVRTMMNMGKSRRVGRNVGKRPDWKKAVVTLREGDKVEFFEGM